MDILDIIKNSVLIKDDSVKVYQYKEKFIIKEKHYTQDNLKYARIEKDFLEYANSEKIKIHSILDIIQEGKKLYIIYNFVKNTGKIDFKKVGNNFKKLHGLKREFNFMKGNDDDLNFEGAEKELEKILGIKILQKWAKISNKILGEYSDYIGVNKNYNIVHGDFDFGNIIAPETIIDTEEMRMGYYEYDIVAFFRMGYRYGNMKAMFELLEGYGYKKSMDHLKILFGYKDFTVTNWLILNNKGEKSRIEDIKKRINNWNSWDYKWVLYS